MKDFGHLSSIPVNRGLEAAPPGPGEILALVAVGIAAAAFLAHIVRDTFE